MSIDKEKYTTVLVYREAREELRYIEAVTGLPACRIVSALIVRSANELRRDMSRLKDMIGPNRFCEHGYLREFCSDCWWRQDELT